MLLHRGQQRLLLAGLRLVSHNDKAAHGCLQNSLAILACNHSLCLSITLRPSVPMPAPEEFEDLESIGRGGFGEVFRCRRKNDGKIFARKRILVFARKISASDEVRRFVREVRLLSRLAHPNIIPIVAANTAAQPFWYVT